MTVRCNAFTLIELLVVIAIIAMLSSLLLASITIVKKSAQQALCVNNIRQCGIICLGMAQDNEGDLTLLRNSGPNMDQGGQWAVTAMVEGYLDLGTTATGGVGVSAQGKATQCPESRFNGLKIASSPAGFQTYLFSGSYSAHVASKNALTGLFENTDPSGPTGSTKFWQGSLNNIAQASSRDALLCERSSVQNGNRRNSENHWYGGTRPSRLSVFWFDGGVSWVPANMVKQFATWYVPHDNATR